MFIETSEKNVSLQEIYNKGILKYEWLNSFQVPLKYDKVFA
jgi:hypothetical protein